MKTLIGLVIDKAGFILINAKVLLSKTFSVRLCFLFISVFVLLGTVQPIYAVSSGITYTGKILDAADAPVTASSVIFTITIYDPSGKCWLYTEQRNLDLSQTAGTFAFEIGSSDASTLYGAAPTFNNQASGGPTNLADLFSNKKSFTGLGTANGCSGTYDPTLSTDPNEGRLLSAYFKIGATGVDQSIPPMRITAVPLAMQALSVNGYGTGELLRVDKSTVTSAGINNNPLSVAQYTEFWSLVNKSSSSYLPATGDMTVASGHNKLTSLLGQVLPAGPATNGQVLVSDGTQWTLQSMGGGGGSGITSVNGLTSATQTFAIGTAGNSPAFSSVTSTHTLNIPMASSASVTAGLISKADYDAFNSKLSAITNAAALGQGKIWIGDAGGLAQQFALSGDATMTSGGVVTANKTTTAQANKLLSLDGSGVAASMGIQLNGIVSGSVTLQAAGTTTNYSLTFPAAQGAAGQTLSNNGSGVLSWVTPGVSQWITTGTDIYYNTGKVGIGTNNPLSKLQVVGGDILLDAAQFLKFGSGGSASISGNGSNFGSDYLDFRTAYTSRMYITNGGNVGIGTTTPTTALDVNGSINAGSNIVANGNVAGAWIRSYSNGSAAAAAYSWNSDTSTGLFMPAAGVLGITTGGLERLRADSSGNVGIGTTTPGSSLDVKGTLRLSGATSGYVGFAPAAVAGSTTYTLPTTQGSAGQVLATDGVAGTPTLSWLTPLSPSTGFMNGGNSFGGNSSLGNNDNFNLDFKTNNTSRMTILNSGNVGIGTTAPSSIISLGGNSARTIGMERNTTADTVGNSLTIQAGGATSGATDKAGGDLVLSSGSSTGYAGSDIDFFIAQAGQGFGTTTRPATDLIGSLSGQHRSVALGINSSATGLYSTAMGYGMNVTGNNSFGINLDTTPRTVSQNNALTIMGGNVGIGTTAPSSTLSFDGSVARTIAMERITTANTAGNDLTIQAGSATSGSTDKNGGILSLQTGTSTGAGYNYIEFATNGGGGVGTTDRPPLGYSRISRSGLYFDYNAGIGFNNRYTEGNGDIYWHPSSSFDIRQDTIANVLKFRAAPSGASSAPISYTTAMAIDGSGNVGIGTTSPTVALDVNGSLKVRGGVNAAVRVVTAAGAITVTTSDYIICVKKTVGAATTVNLPASPSTGDQYVIKDCNGDANTNNITITPAAGTIDGSATYVMSNNRQSVGIFYDGTQWQVF